MEPFKNEADGAQQCSPMELHDDAVNLVSQMQTVVDQAILDRP